MYLKKIEVQGFKSFANKTVFDFSAGVTGIVGPNGSGKSNVSDAVRWVLGEQSAKQLRGGNMQDVIFAGTQTRKPQGFAFVALTLDNSDHALPLDFDEVVVSRRLYRSGESEYMLNGSSCRLKDINELFYDTGIGKDGYSIIGQGQIDKILSTKPEDRRELFDEAVGITKYKRRKLLTEKKLENEHQNLLRITDILNELESRVGPLEKQSVNAKEYLRLRDELKKNEANLFLRENDKMDAELADIDRNNVILSEDLENANNDSAKLREEYEDLAKLLEELDERLDTVRQKISSANIEVGDLNGHINVLNEQINTERLNEEHINSRLAAIARDIETREQSLADYKDQETQKLSAYESAKNNQDEAEKTLAGHDEKISFLTATIEESNEGLISAINARAELHADSKKMDALLEQLQIRRSEIAQKLLKVKSDFSAVQIQRDERRHELDAAEKEISDLNDKKARLQSECADLEQNAANAEQQLRNNQIVKQSREAKLESLRNIAERYEGYGSSVRKVMEKASGMPGVYGVVADIISTEKQYETAIETALGGKIQNVVTDDEDTAKEMIRYLKVNKLGRATFLPLTAMKDRDWDGGAARGEKGFINVASKLVKADPKYGGLVNHLLGRIIVVDNVDDAISIQRKNSYEFRIVTLEGEFLSSGGSMSGGAFKNSSNLLGRKREIEDIEAEIKSIEKTIAEAENKVELTKSAVRTKTAEIEAVKAELQEAAIRRSTAEVALNTAEERLAEFAGSSDSMDNEHAVIENQIAEIEARKAQSVTDIDALDKQHEELEALIASSGEELEQVRQLRENFASTFSQAQLDTAGREQELGFIHENINRINDELALLKVEKDELTGTTAAGKENIDAKNAEIRETEEKIEKLRTGIAEDEITVKEILEKKDSKSGEQKQFFDRRDEIAERIAALDKDIFRLQTRREKCIEKRDARISFMWNEYEISIETAENFRDAGLDEISDTQMKKQVDEFKAEIRALGPVNVNAIEEYKEVSERYELMKTQHSDIVAAEEQLTGIIMELDEGMRKQFDENFAKIQVEFDKVFKELFGGGTGKLELEMDEETDILDAGIGIIAQPPGKKLQNMMQLSGGEKALTAISLVFAIQNLRPSPFALLDEIEAALDDSNVDRFAKYLHKLCFNTQFIVITHRRGTMVSADRLYGITMQEKGVSTLVSVNLIEDELDN